MKTLSLSTSTLDVTDSEALTEKLQALERKTIELEESIRYAGSLQQSILPNERIFKNAFDDAFVMFQPKDIVSGDFYWIATYDEDVYFAVGDCTGHGIPGALLNIAGNAFLRQIIRREGVSDPAKIISMLDIELSSLFNDNRTVGMTRDGMDIVLCKFNLKTMKGWSCNAGRPLVLVRNGDIIEMKKGASAIGYDVEVEKQFETIEFELEKGDNFYLFTDGYTDQFGGDNVKKFNRRRFRNMLCALESYNLETQKEMLALSFEDWKGPHEQIDDVCVVGVKV